MAVDIKTIVDAFAARVNFSDMNLADDINALQEALKRISYITLNQASFANIETITATKTLTDDSPALQILTPSTADRDVSLPAVAATNPQFVITNPSGGSYNLIVKNAGGTVIKTVYPSDTYIIFSDGVTWRAGVAATTVLETKYKITPTVASNNLTLTITHMDGTTPSASRPLWFRIGDTMRAVIAALSVTKASATNWANLGSNEIKTLEQDLFTYVVWNTNLGTPAVDLFWSRIPFGNLYSDFSATTTNEKYAAINATAPAAGNDCVLIGRFAATLSGGAGYTWSSASYTTPTSANLIQRPIYETRLLSFAPTITSDTGSPTTVTNACFYKIINRDIEYLVSVTVVDKGTANGNMNLTYPFLVAITQSAGGRENGATGTAVCAKITATIIGLSLYNGATLWTNTYNPSALIRTVL